MKTQDQARIELERHLGRLSERQWAWVVGEGLAEEIESGYQSAKKIAAKIKTMWQVMGEGPKGSEPSGTEMLTRDRADSTGSRERRRDGVSRLLAVEAGKDDYVVAFRQMRLGSPPADLLSWDQIEGWIKAKAAEAGEPTWFLEVPVPTDLVLRGSAERRALVLSTPVTTEEVPEARPRWSYLRYGTPGSKYVQHIRVRAGSILDDLRKISEDLVKRYSWTSDQATVFILTGIVPLFSLARMTRTYNSALPVASRIEISVDPMVTAEELAEYYRPFRQQMMPGRRNRPLDAKNTELAIFAAGRDPEEPWRETVEAWNDSVREQHEDWVYGEVQKPNFRRDIDLARGRLLRPPYVDPAGPAKGNAESDDRVINAVTRVEEEGA